MKCEYRLKEGWSGGGAGENKIGAHCRVSEVWWEGWSTGPEKVRAQVESLEMFISTASLSVLEKTKMALLERSRSEGLSGMEREAVGALFQAIDTRIQEILSGNHRREVEARERWDERRRLADQAVSTGQVY